MEIYYKYIHTYSCVFLYMRAYMFVYAHICTFICVCMCVQYNMYNTFSKNI